MKFTDDSSTVLGLGHGAQLHSSDLQRNIEKRLAERSAYLEEIGLKPDPAVINEYINGGMAPDDAREAAINKVLSQRPPNSSDGMIERRMQKYIAAGYSTLDAIALAEDELDIEREAKADDYLGDSIENLMAAPVEPSGSSSKSKSYKTIRHPDATQIESALRRDMAA